MAKNHGTLMIRVVEQLIGAVLQAQGEKIQAESLLRKIGTAK